MPRALFLLLLLLSGCAKLPAQCTLSQLAGRYSFVAHGVVFDSFGTGSIYAEAGVIDASPGGAVQLRSMVTPRTAATGVRTSNGSLQVSSDCSGTLTLTDFPPLRIDFVAVSGGREIRFVQASGTTTVLGLALKHQGRCGTAPSGEYGYQLEGWVPSGRLLIPFADTGRVSVTAQGSISGEGTASQSGVPLRRGLSGTLRASSGACEYVLQLQDTMRNAFLLAAYPLPDGNEILILQLDEGVAVHGRARRISAGPPADYNVLPQVVFGGDWQTTLSFTNSAATASPLTIRFFSNSGSPMSVPFAGRGNQTSFALALQPRATLTMRTSPVESMQEGWAHVELPPDGSISGFGVFRQTGSGDVAQEAVVRLSGSQLKRTLLIYDNAGFTNGLAIVNPDDVEEAQADLVARNEDGTVIARRVVRLRPREKLTTALNDQFLPGVGSTSGSLEILTSSGYVSALGLRFSGQAFTSSPSIDP